MQAIAEALAEAHPNIALVKYWGKRDGADNVPATPSLSITLSQLRTRTRVQLAPSSRDRVVVLNGKVVSDAKIEACLDRLVARARSVAPGLRIDTDNNFPTAAGLASSASGFAALITAMDAALGLQMSDVERSIEARRASASAARSLYGGFVTLSGGNDAASWIARPELDAAAWPLAVVIAICSDAAESRVVERRHAAVDDRPLSTPVGPKPPRPTSIDARAAVAARDFDRLGAIAEANCLAMHAVMLSARPALSYWTGATVDVHGRECANCAPAANACSLRSTRGRR